MNIHLIIILVTAVLFALASLSLMGSWGYLASAIVAGYGAYVAFKERKQND